MDLSRLRDIGWKHWDPIGLARGDGAPDEACADEYDQYLVHVARMICQGNSKQESTAYLLGIASEHMGLSVVNAHAAAATTQAIENYLMSLPDGPKTVR